MKELAAGYVIRLIVNVYTGLRMPGVLVGTGKPLGTIYGPCVLAGSFEAGWGIRPASR